MKLRGVASNDLWELEKLEEVSGTLKFHVKDNKSCMVNFVIAPSQVFLKIYEQTFSQAVIF